MCKALDDLWKEAETVGMEKGMEQGLAQGMERGLKQGIERGLEQGVEQGIRTGENYLASLIDCLLQDGRLEEVKSAVKNSAVRHQLYREYGL